jgi:hypothetical protein
MSEKALLNVLAAFNVVVGLVLVGLTTLVLFHLNDVPTARTESARDSCQLLKGLALAATAGSKGATTRTKAYIHSTVLSDCNMYADHIVNHPGSATTTTKEHHAH